MELRDISFHRPGCYRLAVICKTGELQLVHVSEASEICQKPKWKTQKWKAQLSEAQLQLRFYENEPQIDHRSLLDATPLSSCSFHIPQQSLQDIVLSSELRSAPLFRLGDGQTWEEIGVVTIMLSLPTPSHVDSCAVIENTFPEYLVAKRC